MPVTDPLDGTEMPASTDAFNPNTQLATYQGGASPYHNHRIYANASDMNSDTLALDGWIAYTEDTDQFWKHQGGSWSLLAEPEIPLLVPTVTGGTVNDDGVVSFSGATSVIVQGLTSAHRVFEIDYSCSGTASSVAVTLVTSGGTEAVTNYDRSSVISRNATTTSETVTGQSSFFLIGFLNTHHKGHISISDLAHASPTSFIATSGVHGNPAAQSTTNGFVQSFGTHRDSTAYGGVKFTFSNAQSGTLRIRPIR